MRVVIVGEAPGRRGDPSKPLSGAVGKNLAAICGMTEAAFRKSFVLDNVLREWPGRKPGAKGDRWSAGAARLATARFRFGDDPSLFVFLGKRVAKAFGVPNPGRSLCTTFDNGRSLWAVVPHPSAVNRWWNDATNVARASVFFRREVVMKALLGRCPECSEHLPSRRESDCETCEEEKRPRPGKFERCPRCRAKVGKGDEIIACPSCGEACCTVACIAGRNVRCFDCEEGRK